ncbi:PRC-barrel domain-containing protein [Pseudogemmobacter sonorensis]|uniref:PRC-barrel domain-containing protein n=1 Tax=Pseudogemmobacter sonorensis TaxID=2989681 RepID=UPI0036A17D1B
MQQQGQIPTSTHTAREHGHDGSRAGSATISSADVNGTEVFSPHGDHLGKIDHVMIDKVSGKISYAVMSFGGFLGLGTSEHPIPWQKLRYDTRLGGYVTDITKEQLEGAPKAEANWFNDREYDRRTYDHYGIPYYW